VQALASTADGVRSDLVLVLHLARKINKQEKEMIYEASQATGFEVTRRIAGESGPVTD
jgi:hypothetical protein